MDFDIEVATAAAERWIKNSQKRDSILEKIDVGKIADVEPQERIQKRIDHLAQTTTRGMGSRARSELRATGAPRAIIPGLVETIGFERVLGKDDFVGMGFLEVALDFLRFLINLQLSSHVSQKHQVKLLRFSRKGDGPDVYNCGIR